MHVEGIPVALSITQADQHTLNKHKLYLAPSDGNGRQQDEQDEDDDAHKGADESARDTLAK